MLQMHQMDAENGTRVLGYDDGREMEAQLVQALIPISR